MRLRKRFYFITILFCVFIFCSPAKADTDIDSSTTNTNPPIEQKKFDKQQWEKITKNMDFRERKKEKPRPQKTPSYSFPALGGGLAQTIFFILVIGILGYLLFRLLSGSMGPRDKKIEGSTTYSVLSPEENIQESDLELFLQGALKQKEFKLALRIYYLMVIKELSVQQLIDWKKDKTNAEYVRELSGRQYQKEFRLITIAYERVWYGDTELKEPDFESAIPAFNNLIARVKESGVLHE